MATPAGRAWRPGRRARCRSTATARRRWSARAGSSKAAGSRTEAIGLPPNIDPRNGELTVRLDPSLAAGMRDGLDYLEHFDYECTEQTVSRFLPNVLTARALKKLGIANAELEARLPGLVDEGLNRLYNQQHQRWRLGLVDR